MLNTRYDLHDVTFLIPLRVDSNERKANIETVIKVLSRGFNTSIIVLESDVKSNIQLHEFSNSFSHHFVFDSDPVYYKTKYINQLLRMATTTYVAVWDADIICMPEQIEKAILKLRNKECFMVLPYDGRAFSVNKVTSLCFRQTLEYDVLISDIPMMSLMYGCYSTGGAYIVDRNEFLEIGGENENFYGWGPEDIERVKRIEILGQNTHNIDGGIFHLWHPQNNNSWYANKDIEIKNRKEFFKTCQSNKETILLRIPKSVH